MPFNSGFFKRLKSVKQIYVVGYSLGDVDLPYFKELSTKCVVIPISIVKKLFNADKIVADDEAYLKLDQYMKFIIGDLNGDVSHWLMS